MSKSDEKRQKIVEAAYQRLLEYGIEGVRMREIATDVGLTHATLHYYFATKDLLLQAVVSYTIRQKLITHVSEKDALLPPSGRLHAFLITLQKRVQEEPGGMGVLYQLTLHAMHNQSLREELRKNYRGWHFYLKSMLNACQQEGSLSVDLDSETIASLLINYILGLGMALLVPLPSVAEDMLAQLEQWIGIQTIPETKE